MTLLSTFSKRLDESNQSAVEATDVATATNMPFFSQMVKRSQVGNTENEVTEPEEQDDQLEEVPPVNKLHESFTKRLREMADDANT